tara:strand:- start:156 stop:698 length:543 start_codon:yes stop_codon:yes gene_type:complete
MAQNATLDGTSDRGGWTDESSGTSNIHTHADGTSAGTDYIQGVVGFDMQSVGPAIFTLSDVTDPEESSDHKIIYTANATAGGWMGTPGLTIALFEGSFEGSSQIHSTTNTSVSTGTPTEYTINLSSSEANSISDYDDLILRVTNEGNDAGDVIRIYNMYFQCGDAPSSDTGNPAFLLFLD